MAALSSLSSIQINGLELNDGVSFSVPNTNLDDQAPADLRIQKVAFGPPVYTGQISAEKTITLHINIHYVAGDTNYLDFESKLNLLKRAFDTRSQLLSTLRLQRPSQTAKTVLGTAKSFTINKTERWVQVEFAVPDAVWLSETSSKVMVPITTSGQQVKITSAGTTDTFPTLIITWNTPKGAAGNTGNFYTYQVPVTITNNALSATTRIPIELTGYTPPPLFTATAGSGGSIPAQTLSVAVTIQKTRLDGTLGESDATPVSVVVGASGKVTFTIPTTTDAFAYNVYAGAPGSLTLQSTTSQPNPYATTLTVTLAALTTTGAALPTSNTTGWNTAALISAGKMKADGSDIRVLVGNIPAPRVVENLNTQQTKVWALLNLGAQASQTVYIQYGNTLPDPQPDFALGDPLILDTAHSNNYSWTWTQFFDYIYNTRPGSWSPVQSQGVGYGWKQDNNIVHRGQETAYATSPAITFTNQTFSSGSLTGWTVSSTGTVGVDNTNPSPGSLDTYSLSFAPLAANEYVRNTNPAGLISGLSYTIDAWVWADTDNAFVVQVLDSTTTNILAFYYAAGSKAYQHIQLPFTATTTGVSVQILSLLGVGLGRLDDAFIYPTVDVSTHTPLKDPTTNIAQVMGMLHSSVGVNNREVPLNGWEISHPAGITQVTHYGLTSFVGSDYLNNNVLRLMAEDAQYPPIVVWGQPSLTTGGPVAYSTSGSPRVDTIVPPRQRVRFEVNTSVLIPNNQDGTFASIEGVTIAFNPQYVVSVVPQPVQTFYDLNATITQATAGDGDAIVISTPLEPKASLMIDTRNKQVWYQAPDGTQTLRTSALSTVGIIRPFWLQLHPGDNFLQYKEDTVGGVNLEVDWNDSWL